MKILSSLKSELLGILHNRKLLIAIIGVMTVPLLYSGTFLWAFWNPYGHIDRLPVAVVNNDQGAIYNGEKLEIGQDLVDNLKKKKSFNWKFVSENKANKGIKARDYYIKIEIPKDFSKNATTLQDEHPKKLNIIYTPNEGFNYLSSKIGDSAIEKIKEEVSSEVTKTYAKSMFENIQDVADGLGQASDGAEKLYDGINQAENGTGDLKAGMQSAKDGATELSNGAKKLNDGAIQVQQNLEMLAEKSVVFSKGLKSASSGSKQLQVGMEQFKSGFGQMKDGNSQLLAGAEKSKNGVNQLATGLNSVTANLPNLQNGSKQLADGSNQLGTSVEQWNKGAQNVNKGAEKVNAGLQQTLQKLDQMIAQTSDPTEKGQLAYLKGSLQQLASGSQQVADGVGQLADNASKITAASGQLTVGANKLYQGQSQFIGGLNQLASGAKQLQGGQNQLVEGLTVFGGKITEAEKGVLQLVGGSQNLSTGLDQLAAGAIQLEDGTSKLAEGSSQFSIGTTKLSDGSLSLADGMSQLANGTDDLSEGMEKLSDGSKELSTELHKGAKDASDVKSNNDVYNMFAKPVVLKDARLNHVPDYGTGFTPYFLSLSLFVGALVLSIIFPMLEPAGEPKSGISWFAGKVGILLGVGIVQALLADIVLLNILGLDVKSIPYFIMLSIFTSWTFLAIIQFLVTVLDNPGRFLGIIILILQLTSSAGTYPIELVPKVLQKITDFLPMTYTIAGFRSVISTGDFSFMWENIEFISIFFFAFLAGTFTFFVVKFKRQNQMQYQ